MLVHNIWDFVPLEETQRRELSGKLIKGQETVAPVDDV